MHAPLSALALLALCAAPAREPYADLAFFGYACSRECTSLKAGFAWAERSGIVRAADCEAADPAERDGCHAFVATARTAFEAGFEWAAENEIAEPCQCDGAGPGFRAGCRAYLESGCAEAWPGCAEAFPGPGRGR